MQGKKHKTSAARYPNLVMRCTEFIPRSPDNINQIPWKTRGIYSLLKEKKDKYHVVYIGLGNHHGGIRARLRNHATKWNKGKWSHFSFFEVWPNIPDNWIEEMEAFFLQFFSTDLHALELNEKMKFGKFRKVTFEPKNLDKFKIPRWKEDVNPVSK